MWWSRFACGGRVVVVVLVLQNPLTCLTDPQDPAGMNLTCDCGDDSLCCNWNDIGKLTGAKFHDKLNFRCMDRLPRGLLSRSFH